MLEIRRSPFVLLLLTAIAACSEPAARDAATASAPASPSAGRGSPSAALSASPVASAQVSEGTDCTGHGKEVSPGGYRYVEQPGDQRLTGPTVYMVSPASDHCFGDNERHSWVIEKGSSPLIVHHCVATEPRPEDPRCLAGISLTIPSGSGAPRPRFVDEVP